MPKSSKARRAYEAAYAKDQMEQKGHWEKWYPKGYAYLLGNKALGFYKIGLTQKLQAPDARFREIQQGVPFDLDVVHYWFVMYVHAFERLLHHTFRENSIRGEWFKFNFEDIKGVTDKIRTLAEEQADGIGCRIIFKGTSQTTE